MLQHTYVENNHLVYSLSKNEQSIHRYQRWTISVLILVSVEYAYVYSTCRQGYPRTDTSRHLYSHTEVSLRYFYLMDYYLISTGTGISIYTRPMSWPYIVWQPAWFRKSDPIWGKRTANKWTKKCDGGPYNGADGVHCPFIYIYNGKTSISKKESDACLCAMAIHCRAASSILKIWPNLRQENRQQVATKVWWGFTMVLIVSIGLLYTYT